MQSFKQFFKLPFDLRSTPCFCLRCCSISIQWAKNSFKVCNLHMYSNNDGWIEWFPMQQKPYFAVYLAVIDTMSDDRPRSGKISKSRFLRQFVSVRTYTQSPATLFTFFLKGAIAVVMLVFQGPSLLCHLSRPIQKNL